MSCGNETDSIEPADVTIDPDELPERDFTWGDPIRAPEWGIVYCPAFPADGDDYIDVGDNRYEARSFGVVLSGAEKYVDAKGGLDNPFTPPATYTEIANDFEPRFADLSTIGPGYGHGITASVLESAIRVATGGGHFDHESIEVIPCKFNPFVVRTPEGTFLAPPRPVDSSPGRVVVEHDINGFTVPNETGTPVLEGIKALTETMEDVLGITVVDVERNDASDFTFVTDDGEELSINGHDVAQLADLKYGPDRGGEQRIVTPQYDADIEVGTVNWNPENAMDKVGDTGEILGTVVGHVIDTTKKPSYRGSDIYRVVEKAVRVSMTDHNRINVTVCNGRKIADLRL